MCGKGLKLKRGDKVLANAFGCEPKALLKSDVDMPTLIFKDFKMDFKGADKILCTKTDLVGQDLDNYVTDITSILPTFSLEGDADLVPLLNTKLM